jgi:hypothetical protein
MLVISVDIDLIVRTQYDERDYMSVEEIFYYDENGDEIICSAATEACIDISTCAHQGTDLWSYLRESIETRLRGSGLQFNYIHFADDRGNYDPGQ